MAIKDKAWLITLVGSVLSLIGWCTPYIWVQMGSVYAMTWSWGLIVTSMGSGFSVDLMIGGILIIIGAILGIATGYLAKSRENLKTMAIAWLVSGILVLVGVIIPVAMMGMAVGLSIGFFLPLIGSILAIIAGILPLAIK
ncbi:MAG: hypothetical protein ACFE9X_01220 [Promethearchaeota archaeon]